MEVEEPALVLDSVKRRVPFDRLAHAGNGTHDERVEEAPDLAFPARHRPDVGLHGGVAVGLRDLRVAACEEPPMVRRSRSRNLLVDSRHPFILRRKPDEWASSRR
jgi:hypothetical protein